MMLSFDLEKRWRRKCALVRVGWGADRIKNKQPNAEFALAKARDGHGFHVLGASVWNIPGQGSENGQSDWREKGPKGKTSKNEKSYIL